MPRRKNIRHKTLARDGHKCAQCGADVSAPVDTGFASARVDGAEVDHRIALALGGADEVENCSVLCIPCHRRKTRADVRKIAKAKRVGKRNNLLAARLAEKAGQ
jgi:5-methylcytosine-specific restriction enzyme A